MYNINLIHEKIVPVRKQRKRLGLVSFYALIWAVSAVIIVSLVITNTARVRSYAAAARRLEDRNALPPGLTNDDVVALSRQLQASTAVLMTVQQQTMLWGPKLRLLRHHLPEGAWFNRLSCRQAQPPSGQPPPPSGQPGGQPAQTAMGEFVIEGMLLIPDGGMGTEPLERYATTLREDKTFMAGLSKVDLHIVERRGIGRREVASFVLVCTIAEGVRFDA